MCVNCVRPDWRNSIKYIPRRVPLRDDQCAKRITFTPCKGVSYSPSAYGPRPSIASARNAPARPISRAPTPVSPTVIAMLSIWSVSSMANGLTYTPRRRKIAATTSKSALSITNVCCEIKKSDVHAGSTPYHDAGAASCENANHKSTKART